MRTIGKYLAISIYKFDMCKGSWLVQFIWHDHYHFTTRIRICMQSCHLSFFNQNGNGWWAWFKVKKLPQKNWPNFFDHLLPDIKLL